MLDAAMSSLGLAQTPALPSSQNQSSLRYALTTTVYHGVPIMLTTHCLFSHLSASLR